ncbi:1-acyl-sn-glycerol-3-phosphate acyltransferase [Hymenobacter sp. CRA2]|uniref:1-acyl-sn-glycerol-3-phosphate acyltransferase n=1 Tax=Hymenobacter sp. CRA2 TaxID=1955620 RepID=UPI00098F2FCD|nr:1-acyl-sn-glycerol-3-phosphate acyltransferase [Hymenobacter sp. CRA2]OON69384.1 glycerol acyltransferase [Hymenobacter sp. CRA2]
MNAFWLAFSKFWFKLVGWRLASSIPPDIRQAMMIAAPHTSNWDFMHARAAFFLMRRNVRFTVKKEWTDIPLLGKLMLSLGALPIDRSKNNSMVEAMKELFQEHPDLIILITPEGTRKYQPRWRRGYYFAAQAANVPILLGYLDYSKKEAGVGPAVYPTGNYEQDEEKIKAFYRTKKGRFPEQGIR